MAGTANRATPAFKDSPVWEEVITYTLTTTSGGDAITQVIPVNGILQKIVIASGAAAGISGTLTLAIKDNGGNTIFPATAGPAEAAESTFSVWEPITGTMSVIVDPSDDPTSGTWEIVVTLRGIK